MKYLSAVILLFPVGLFAQSSTPVPNLEPAAQGQWIIDLAANHPALISILVLIGSLRLVLKPLFALLHTFFLNEGLTSYDNKETAIEQSQVMKVVFFILDYCGSIKMPVPQAPSATPVAPTQAPPSA